MDELSKSIFLDIFQDPNTVVIADSTFLSSLGAKPFLNFLSQLGEDDGIGTGMVISDKTFEMLKKIVSDHDNDYDLRKRASDALVALSRLTQDKRVRIYGDAFDKTDENTVLLMQLTRLRTNYAILFLSASPVLLQDADMINDFGSVHGELISIGFLDENGNFVSQDEEAEIEPVYAFDDMDTTQEETEEAEADDEWTTCMKCGKRVRVSETVEEVCEDCLSQIVGVTYCVDCGKPIPVTFRDQYIDQNVRGRRCEDCEQKTDRDNIWIGASTPVQEDVDPESFGSFATAPEVPEMVTCSQCGRLVPAEEAIEEICPDCFNRVVEERFCIECGAKIPVTFGEKYVTGEVRELCEDCLRKQQAAPQTQAAWTPAPSPFEPAPVQMVECPRCHRMVPADQTEHGYCQDCLNQLVSQSFCCECGRPIPITLRDSLEGNGQTKLYCDQCSKTFAEEDHRLTNASSEDTVECPACHRMVPVSQTEHGYCQDCLNQVVEHSFCIECGKPMDLTFRDVYFNEGRTGLYCEACQKKKDEPHPFSDDLWKQPEAQTSQADRPPMQAAPQPEVQVRPDLSGWSTL